ncbi:MAG: hypothetical protein LBN34_02255 [Clostridiales Family XIII bacterium]|nr:hypothetical protein [Clostridiales Family XIII bacterium]
MEMTKKKMDRWRVLALAITLVLVGTVMTPPFVGTASATDYAGEDLLLVVSSGTYSGGDDFGVDHVVDSNILEPHKIEYRYSETSSDPLADYEDWTEWSSDSPYFRNVGTYYVQARAVVGVEGDDTEYARSYVEEIVIEKAPLEITPVANPNPVPYGTAPSEIDYSYTVDGFLADDGFALGQTPTVTSTYSANTESGTELSLTLILGVLNEPASGNYDIHINPAKLYVGKATLTGDLTLGSIDAVYDNNAHAAVLDDSAFADATYTKEYRTGETYTPDGNWSDWATDVPSFTNVGTYFVQAQIIGNGNYDGTVVSNIAAVEIKPFVVKIETFADPASVVYGTDPADIEYGYNLLTGSDDDWLTDKLGNPNVYSAYTANTPVTEEGVPVEITLPELGNANYNYQVVRGILTVEKAVATVSVDNVSRGIGGSDPALSARTTGFINGDAPEVGTDYWLERTPGEAIDDYPIVIRATVTKESLGNYDITWEDGTLSITDDYSAVPEISIVGKSLTATYDKGEHSVSGVSINEDHALPGGWQVYYSTSGASGKNATSGVSNTVGDVRVLFNGYDVSQDILASGKLTSTDGKLVIKKVNVTVTVDTWAKTVGDDDPVFTGEISGLLSGEKIGTVTYGRVSADADKEAVGSKIGITAKVSNLNANYSVTVVDGTLTIEDSDEVIGGGEGELSGGEGGAIVPDEGNAGLSGLAVATNRAAAVSNADVPDVLTPASVGDSTKAKVSDDNISDENTPLSAAEDEGEVGGLSAGVIIPIVIAALGLLVVIALVVRGRKKLTA